MHCMLNGKSGVIDLGLSLAVHGVESELLLVDTVGEAKEWIVGAFDHADDLTKSAIELTSLVVSSNWDEVSQLLGCNEGIQGDTNVDLVVEGDVVEKLLQVGSKHLVIGEGVSWHMIQVLLE